MPEVSVIMPMYNARRFVRKAIDSVSAQTLKEWELLVVDDGSTDGSAELVAQIAKEDPRIRLLALENNLGPALARNKAIAEARGRYIAFLDSDDMWTEEKLEKQIAFMKRTGAALSHTGYYRIDAESEKVLGRIRVPAEVDYRELLKQNVIGCLTAVYDAKRLGKVYMPDIRKRQDFALWLKILKSVPFAYGLDEPLAKYRIHTGGSVSSNKLKASFYNWKLYREIEKLPLHKALYYFGCYTFRSLKKYGTKAETP